MAQEIQYNDNNVTYTEGPFVIVNHPHHSLWRIEVERKHCSCPVPPEYEIYDLCANSGRALGWLNHNDAVNLCNRLNYLVSMSLIVLHNNVWVPAK